MSTFQRLPPALPRRLAALLLAALAAACGESAASLPAARKLSFEARSTTEAVRAERAPIVLARVEPAAFDARAGVVEGGSWRPEGERKARLHLRGEFDLGAGNRLAVRLAAPDGAKLRVAARAGGQTLGVLEMESEDRSDEAALLDLPATLDVRADELVLLLSGLDRATRVGDVQLLARPPAARVPLPGAGPESFTSDRETRRAFGLTVAAPLAGSLELAGDERLRLALACPGDRDARVRFALEGVAQGREWTVGVPADGRWVVLDEDLAPLGAGSARVRIELDSGDPCAVSVPSVVRPAANAPTVLLVTSDTHRGDHLSFVSGAELVATPRLDALAARGTAFLDARSPTHITNPAHVSLLTGVHPLDHGIHDNRTPVTSDAHTLADAFAEAGWATLAATSASHLGPDRSGLAQGFEAYVAPGLGDPWKQLDAIERLERLLPEADGRPAFLWLHVFDAHSPYRPSRRFAERYVDPDHDPRDPSLPEPPRRVAWDLEVRDLEHLVGLYRAEVAELDQRLERLFEWPRVAEGWIAFTADHGERLNTEDGVLGHETLDRACLHVPLVLAGPRVPTGVTSTAPVTHRDLGRTLLDLAGLSGVDFPGRDLLEAEPPPAAPRFAVARYRRSVSVEQDGWLLVRHLVDQTRSGPPIDFRAGEERLYHLPSDPDATVDRLAEESARSDTLRALLDDSLARRRDLEWGVLRESSAAEQFELEALGYAGD